MTAGLAGVLRDAARLDSSEEAFAVWPLTFCATGPVGKIASADEACDRPERVISPFETEL